MKKLITILSVVSISSTMASVSACSLVNYEKQYIKNKVNTIMDVASVASRSAIINDVEGIDVDYLNKYIGNQKINKTLPKFSASQQTITKSVVESTFGQLLDRKFYEELDQNSAYSLEGKKTADSYADSIVTNGSLILSTIKTAGGIKPSLGGVIEGLIPQLSSLLSNVSNEFNITNNYVNNINSLAPYGQLLIKDLDNTKLVSTLLKLILNINFINDKEIDDSVINGLLPLLVKDNSGDLSNTKNTTIPLILEHYINNVMFKNFKGTYTNSNKAPGNISLTPKVVQQSALVKLNKLLIRLNGKKDDNSKKQLLRDDYEPIENAKWIRENIGENLGYLINNFSNLNYVGILESIDDVFYIIGALLINLGIFDFETDFNKNPTANNLFNDSLDNKTYFKNMNSQDSDDKMVIKFDSQLQQKNGVKTNGVKNTVTFSSYKMLKNLTKATDPNNKDGRDMQRILFLLLYSNSPQKEDYSLKTDMNILDLLPLGSSNSQYEENDIVGVDSLLGGIVQGLGYKLFDILKSVTLPPSLKDIAGLAASRLLGVTVDSIANDKNIQGLGSLLNSLSSSTGLSISKNNIKLLEHGYQALWDEKSTLLTDLLNMKLGDKPLNLKNLFSMKLTASITINTVLKMFSEIYSDTSKLRAQFNSKFETWSSGGVKDGIATLSKSLGDKLKIYYSDKINNDNGVVNSQPDKNLNDKNGEYNRITTALSLIKYPGLALRDSSYSLDNKKTYIGTKGVMYSLGYVEGQDKFIDETPLKALEQIFDDSNFKNLENAIINDFNYIGSVKEQYIKDNIEIFTDYKNFNTELVSYSNIEDESNPGKIEFKIEYISPKDKSKHVYNIKLSEYANLKNWTIESITK
ncbi:MOLPALP family lipoprotein [Spiroplasma gladiatoris]|uniref:MOLPALP family lipoprotein n=1 Tax=Spiroplasma gladiatoris TaxID=2143 RepID=A0A4P7AI71_9MOLU|nr:hypothetical protein [Spiroplasma gladiatoris]QBQ07871.1 MOLPALP family lipoprotein [Spiroplasma gladiatoris]